MIMDNPIARQVLMRFVDEHSPILTHTVHLLVGLPATGP